MVPFVTDKVDKNGRITDATSRQLLKELLEAFVVWALRFKT